jgi:hypothetical protein
VMGRELLWAVCGFQRRGRATPWGAYEGALKSSMIQADPQLVDNCAEIGADVRRWARARDSLHSMSDKARGNGRDGGGCRPALQGQRMARVTIRATTAR